MAILLSCRDLAKAGGTLCLVDIRNTGETRFEPPNSDWNTMRFHYHFRWSFWLGRTMLGEWTTDLLALLKTTAAIFPGRPLELVAFDETGLAALAAAAISGPVKVRTIRMPGSCLARHRPVSRSMAVYVPHLLEWGDISMLAALVDGDVEIINPVDRQWEPYDSAMCRGLESETHALAARFGLSRRVKVSAANT